VPDESASPVFRKTRGGETIGLLHGFTRVISQVPRPLWLPIVALIVGALLLPIAAYVGGTHLVAPYEGAHGLGSFFGAIYADAARGHPLALSLLLGPVLVVVIWKMNGWLWRLTAR
jgi:hypothetical protein